MREHPAVRRPVRLRGHEVVTHTSAAGGLFRCCVFLLDPHEPSGRLRVFSASDPEPGRAEGSALTEALEFLESPRCGTEAQAPVRRTLGVAGRQVDIFCDQVGHGLFQAFPFLRRSDGSLDLIMQFHLTEAITATSPEIAIVRCIGRLESYFTGSPSPS